MYKTFDAIRADLLRKGQSSEEAFWGAIDKVMQLHTCKPNWTGCPSCVAMAEKAQEEADDQRGER